MMPDAKNSTPVRLPPALLGAGVVVVILGFGLPAILSQPQGAPPSPPQKTAPAGAETFAPRTPAPLPEAPGSIALALVRLVVSLAVVCGGCVLVVRWLGKKPPDAPNPAMVVVASLTVGRCAVHLVRAGDRRILLGTDVSGVKALVELPGAAPEPVPEALPLESPGANDT